MAARASVRQSALESGARQVLLSPSGMSTSIGTTDPTARARAANGLVSPPPANRVFGPDPPKINPRVESAAPVTTLPSSSTVTAPATKANHRPAITVRSRAGSAGPSRAERRTASPADPELAPTAGIAAPPAPARRSAKAVRIAQLARKAISAYEV